MIIPVSVVIPTYNRYLPLEKTLDSIAIQSIQPQEIIIIDASDNKKIEDLCKMGIVGLRSSLIWAAAQNKGAAVQRNQGVNLATQSFIAFMDDDIYLEPDCLKQLWICIQSNTCIGGVNAMITNQKYLPPGRITKLFFRILSGEKLDTYAGKCIGPAWNLLPEDNPNLPEFVACEWLNTTCSLYRKEALPIPVFESHFTGYSLMEDLTLSLKVGKKWELFNAREARIYHDSQTGEHKNNIFALAKMEIVNRYYVMTSVLERRSNKDHFKFLLFQLFQVASSLNQRSGWRKLPALLGGKISGIWQIIQRKY